MPTPEFDAMKSWLLDLVLAALAADDARRSYIGTGDTPLAERIIIRNRPDGSIYLHRWLRSDLDDLHDHPWDSTSVVLLGGYWEVTPAGRVFRKPGDTTMRKAEDLHRIELDPAHPEPWSLFITRERRRAWGFATPDGWVDGESYRGFNPGALRREAVAGG